jgi:hypothetical protein
MTLGRHGEWGALVDPVPAFFLRHMPPGTVHFPSGSRIRVSSQKSPGAPSGRRLSAEIYSYEQRIQDIHPAVTVDIRPWIAGRGTTKGCMHDDEVQEVYEAIAISVACQKGHRRQVHGSVMPHLKSSLGVKVSVHGYRDGVVSLRQQEENIPITSGQLPQTIDVHQNAAVVLTPLEPNTGGHPTIPIGQGPVSIWNTITNAIADEGECPYGNSQTP